MEADRGDAAVDCAACTGSRPRDDEGCLAMGVRPAGAGVTVPNGEFAVDDDDDEEDESERPALRPEGWCGAR
jgi:hypothetical protein